MNPGHVICCWQRLVILSGLSLWAAILPGGVEAQRHVDRTTSFDELLKEMSAAPGNGCEGREDLSRLEEYLFDQAEKTALGALNDAGAAAPAYGAPSAPKDRVARALTGLEHSSAEINGAWAEENRFHFEVLDIPPALVVKMTFRNRATFTVFGIPEFLNDQKANSAWKTIRGTNDGRFEPRSGYDWVDLFPLQRGPSRMARFLAKFGTAGCGSGVGVSYYAYEWDPEAFGDLAQIIKLEGAVSQQEPADERRGSKKDLSSWFPPIGELKTGGRFITLPYCWFSQIDTWNNPSLCAVDSYDISGDQARFLGRVTNRPDLVPIAKAIEYGQAHDFPALLAYCASPRVARLVIRSMPPHVFASAGLTVKRISKLRERIEMEDSEVLQFDVEERGGRWLVAGFRME